MIEKIPIKFHVEGNKLILDEMWIILSGDSIVIEQFIDINGKLNTTDVYLERRTILSKESFSISQIESS